jgi:UDP-N-acetylmuramate dehydrogenase
MLSRLLAIPGLKVSENAPLSDCTRFAIGGPARWLVDVPTEEALAAGIAEIRRAGVPLALIGGGTNLIVSDDGFPGVVLRYTASHIDVSGSVVRVEAGASLQSLVDFSIERGLGGLETLTGIPGWAGGSIYGNAGAYGHSIQERIESVRIFMAAKEGGCEFRELDNAACHFAYRESVFKRHRFKESDAWIVTSATLRLIPADSTVLRTTADGILKIRNEKYPPSMRCAGSIFKNLILSQLPESVRAQIPAGVIREGKVPSAYFLEQAGAKGMANGAIHVADYHANLIYNTGGGSAAELRHLIQVLKSRVRELYGLDLEEEVQFIP